MVTLNLFGVSEVFVVSSAKPLTHFLQFFSGRWEHVLQDHAHDACPGGAALVFNLIYLYFALIYIKQFKPIKRLNPKHIQFILKIGQNFNTFFVWNFYYYI